MDLEIHPISDGSSELELEIFRVSDGMPLKSIASAAPKLTPARDTLTKKKGITVVKGDLFSYLNTSATAAPVAIGHAVSVDLVMGKGIAVEFKKRFGKVAELKAMVPTIGKTLIIKNNQDLLGYVVTKKYASGKPTLGDFNKAVIDFYTQLKSSGVKVVYFPKIGAGLDNLPLEEVIKTLSQQQTATGIATTMVLLPDDDSFADAVKFASTYADAPGPITAPAAAVVTAAAPAGKKINIKIGGPAPAPAAPAKTKSIVVKITKRKLLGTGDVPDIEELTASPAYMTYKLNGVDWVLPHNRQFGAFINSHFHRYTLPEGKFKLSCSGSSTMSKPFPYQEFIRDYMGFGTPYRGILLNHGLGSGKTRTTIMVSETFRVNGHKTLFFGPASLRNNFIEELLRWGNDDIRLPADFASKKPDEQEAIKRAKKELINNSYLFVSSNASNLLVQLARYGIGHPVLEDNSKAVQRYLEKHPGRLDYPRHMLVVIEEAHNANQTFTNTGAKALPEAYLIFKNAVDCKFIALSATPIINNPFEICTLFNLLRGPLPGGKPLLPESEKQFIDLYVDYNTDKIVNQDRLARSLQGLVSYYKGITNDIDIFPDLDEKKDVFVKMSEYQAPIYKVHAEEEMGMEQKKKRGVKQKLSSAPGVKGEMAAVSEKYKQLEPKSSYRAHSRAACNYVWPEDVPKPLTDPELDFAFEFRESLIPDDIAAIDDDAHRLRAIKALAMIFGIAVTAKDTVDDIYDKIAEYKDPVDDYRYGEVLTDSSISDDMKKHLLTRAILQKFGGIIEVKKLPTVDKDGKIVTETVKYAPRTAKKRESADRVSLPSEVREFLTSADETKFFFTTAKKGQRLARALDMMSAKPDKYFSDEALAKYTPKMLEIYRNIVYNGDGRMQIVAGPSDDPEIVDSAASKVAEEVVDGLDGTDGAEHVDDLEGDDDDPEFGQDEQSGGGYDEYGQDEEDFMLNTHSIYTPQQFGGGEAQQFGGAGDTTENIVWFYDEAKSENYWLAPTFIANPFEYNEKEYSTIMHAFQAQKDPDNDAYVSQLTGASPKVSADMVIDFGGAKSFKEKGYHIVDGWKDIRDELMLEILTAFYDQNPDLKARLISTRPKYLAYWRKKQGSHWGVSRTGKSGENAYGELLMGLRDEFASDEGLEHMDTLPLNPGTALLSKLDHTQDELFDKSLLSGTGTRHIIGGPSLVYSVFAHGEGVGIFKRILNARGYELFAPSKYNFANIESMEFAPRYTVISGDVDMDTRVQIMKFFNHPLNRHGQLIRIILVTSAASEGISLHYVRQVHIMEPFWHNVRVRQVIGRARRLCSHQRLPPPQRIVHVYKYFSVLDLSAKGVPIEETTDLYLKFVAHRKDNLISSVMKVLYGSAVDCVLNSTQNDPEGSGYECFKFPAGDDDKSMAFTSSLDKDVAVASKVKKVEEKLEILMHGDKSLGGYKVDERGKPTETKVVKIDLSRDPKLSAALRTRLTPVDGKEMSMVPLYDEIQAKSGVFTKVRYVFNLLSTGKVIYPASVIVEK